MRFVVFLFSTIMAIITVIFHVVYKSTLLFALLRVALIWIGCAIIISLTSYLLEIVIGQYAISLSGEGDLRRSFSLVSQPEDDEYFR